MTKPTRVIYWFRTDLRLHDSPALAAALDLSPEAFYPIWTWDPHYVYRARVGPNRFQYLLDCQNDLSASITKLNKNSKLFVVREAPTTVFAKLFKAWGISHLVFEKDVDAYAKDRDAKVMQMAKECGVEVVTKSGRTLWDAEELVKKNGGKPTMSISQVQNAGPKVGSIPRPLPAPKSLPDPGELKVDFEREKPSEKPDFNANNRGEANKTYDEIAGPKGDFAVPTLEELGMSTIKSVHRGGETRALEALDKITKDKDYTATFQKPMTAPTDFNPQSTTLLSPHLHFGSLSVREFYWRVQDIVSKHKGASHPPASLTGQLFFRDMYFAAQAALGYQMAQTYANPQVRFVPWHLPSKIDTSNNLITGSYDVDNPEAEVWFRRWKFGRTGFPWIDALMRQLRQEGWIHHLGRHAVACFLTRGGCYVDWERGAEVFEEWLIDHETACNTGNWQWLSCTAFFAQFYRCYSPISFPQKWDKNGDYVRHYVPELAKFDKKYIYEPHKAPIADQKKWGCVVKGDGGGGDEAKLDEAMPEENGVPTYPKPMFDFNERRRICIDGMKTAYAVNLRGADKKVMDGSWRKEFDDAAEGPTEGKSGLPGAMLDEEDDGWGEVNGAADGNEADQDSGDDKAAGKKHKRQESGTKENGSKQGTMDGHVRKSARTKS